MSKNPPVNPAKDSEQKLYYKESSQLTGLVPKGDNLEKKKLWSRIMEICRP